MTEQPNPGSHPDAELLSGFIEGVLPEHERASCLSHFAECERCREIVFLAQPTGPLGEVKVVAAKRGWSRPLPLFAGALAAAALITVLTLSRAPQMPPARVAQNSETTESSARNSAVLPSTESEQVRVVAPPPAAQVKKTRAPKLMERKAAKAAPAPTPVATPAAAEPTVAAANGAPERFVARSAAAAMPSAVARELSEIKGRVIDSTGAAVSGAAITIQPLAGTRTMKTRTNSLGEFTIAALPSGKYEVQIESPGFQKEATQVELKAPDTALLESTLKVGSAAETVEVSAGAATVQTNTSQLESMASPAGVLKRRSQEKAEPALFVTTVSNGAHVVALDGVGQLFYRKGEGENWKAVKAKWRGKVTQITAVNDGKAQFQLTTDGGDIWMSSDGVHWHSSSPKKR